MAQFDPTLREETWVFQDIGRRAGKQPVYKRAGFVLVSYDGDPERYIEPLNAFPDVQENNSVSFIKNGIDTGRVAGFEFIRGRMFETQVFNGDAADV